MLMGSCKKSGEIFVFSKFKKILLTLTILSQGMTAFAEGVGKCCESGEVFSVNENFTCASAKDRKRELYHLKKDANGKLFAGCDETQNLTITSLGDLEGGVISAPSACVDLLWDEAKSRAIPILFQCQEIRKNNVYTNKSLKSQEPEIVRAPILTSLRVCCGPEHFYDTQNHDCLPIAEIIDDQNDGLDGNLTSINNSIELINRLKVMNESVDFVTIVRGAPTCKHAVVDYKVNISNGLKLLDNGKLEVLLSTEDGPVTILASEENSCLDIDPLEPDLMVFRLCKSYRYCQTHACIRKCCPEGEAMIDEHCRKLPADAPDGFFYNSLLNSTFSMNMSEAYDFLNRSDYGLLVGKTCDFGMFSLFPHEVWNLTKSGQLYVKFYRLYKNDDYCMDTIYESGSTSKIIYPFPCFDSPVIANDDTPMRWSFFAIFEAISCIFLIMTLLVYICLPALQNLHGKTLMCHVASLIAAYANLSIVGIASPENPSSKDNVPCRILGYAMLLSWYSAFTWLNVMCFDIWWTFGGVGAVRPAGKRSGAYKKRFLMYSLYAWGFALFMTSVSFAADQTKILPRSIRPNIGVESCWFEKSTLYYGEVIFFIGPISIQFLVNLIFFVLTVIYCSKVKAELTKVMGASSDHRSRRFRSDRSKLLMNIKLFVVMGVAWGMEAVSAFLNHYAVTLAWRKEFFYVSDFLNALQGVFIFALFVLKGKVYHALRQRLGYEKPKLPSSQTGGLQDPYRVRNSASSSTIVSTTPG